MGAATIRSHQLGYENGPQAAGTVGDAAVFTVHIDLDSTDLPLRPGMTGRAEITGDS